MSITTVLDSYNSVTLDTVESLPTSFSFNALNSSNCDIDLLDYGTETEANHLAMWFYAPTTGSATIAVVGQSDGGIVEQICSLAITFSDVTVNTQDKLGTSITVTDTNLLPVKVADSGNSRCCRVSFDAVGLRYIKFYLISKIDGNYLTFNGTDQYAEIPTADLFDFDTGDFTFSVRIKVNDLGDGGYIVAFSKLGQGFNIRYYSSGTIYIWLGFSTTGYKRFSIPSFNIYNNKFIHLVVGKIGNDCFVYIDGETIIPTLVTDQTDGYDIIVNCSNPVRIGCLEPSPGIFYHLMNASIDDIRFYNKVLSLEEVQDIYNGGFGRVISGSEDGLIWGSNCNNGAGDTFTDITGTVNGTLVGNSGDNMWISGGSGTQITSNTRYF